MHNYTFLLVAVDRCDRLTCPVQFWMKHGLFAEHPVLFYRIFGALSKWQSVIFAL